MPIKINLAPPRYVMTTTTLERTEGLSVLNQAMAVIKKNWGKEGRLQCSNGAQSGLNTDETELARQLERLEGKCRSGWR